MRIHHVMTQWKYAGRFKADLQSAGPAESESAGSKPRSPFKCKGCLCRQYRCAARAGESFEQAFLPLEGIRTIFAVDSIERSKIVGELVEHVHVGRLQKAVTTAYRDGAAGVRPRGVCPDQEIRKADERHGGRPKDAQTLEERQRLLAVFRKILASGTMETLETAIREYGLSPDSAEWNEAVRIWREGREER